MMITGPFILSLILGLCLSAPSNTGVNRRPDGILIKFDDLDEFCEYDFVHAYLIGLDELSEEDVGRLFHFITDLPDLGLGSGFKYGYLLREIVRRGSLESFQCVYPHVQFSKEDRLDVALMVECANCHETGMLYYMMERGFDAGRFINIILTLSEFLDIPHAIIDTVGLAAARNAEVYAMRDEIYTFMLNSFLLNEIALYDYQKLAEELIRRGADVDRARAHVNVGLIEEVKRRSEEENAELPSFLDALFSPPPAPNFGIFGLKRKREVVFRS
jgi:hypothetical protein